MRRPLEDVTILAVERYGAGPRGTVHLTALRARIIAAGCASATLLEVCSFCSNNQDYSYFPLITQY